MPNPKSKINNQKSKINNQQSSIPPHFPDRLLPTQRFHSSPNQKSKINNQQSTIVNPAPFP